jgi:antitoxin component of RelBE/YafQ-DinJ toxin-antitoxin module
MANTQSSQLIIRIDEQLKNKAMSKAQKLGLSLSTLTKMFFISFVKNKDIIKIDEEMIWDQALKSERVKKQFVNISKALDAI